MKQGISTIPEAFTNDDEGGLHQMLKDLAWNIFINVGIVDSYMFYREIEERDRAAEQNKLAEAETATSASHA